jgi:hypothetical protein
MKKILVKLLVIASFVIIPSIMMSQTPPHPNGGNAPDSGNTPVGGGAPIGSGLVIMIALGAAYGGKKVYKLNQRGSN